MTKTQQQEIVFALSRDRQGWVAKRREANRHLRMIDAQVAAVLDSNTRKRRAGGTARRVDNETGNRCRISKMKVSSTRAERKRGLARKADAEKRIREVTEHFTRPVREAYGEGGVR